MKTKLMTLQDATGFFRDGMTIMVGGFMGIGTPSAWLKHYWNLVFAT